MPATTPAHAIPYPVAGDALRELPTTAQANAERIETLLTSILTPPAATNPTYATDWSAFGGGFAPVSFYVHLRRCYIQGLAMRSNTTAAAGTAVFTLPAGARPSARLALNAYYAGGTLPIYIETTGVVSVQGSVPAGNGVGFTGISFRIA